MLAGQKPKLSAIEQGDPQAAEQLLPLVYDELRKLAAAKLIQEAPGQTLQPTALGGANRPSCSTGQLSTEANEGNEGISFPPYFVSFVIFCSNLVRARRRCKPATRRQRAPRKI